MNTNLDDDQKQAKKRAQQRTHEQVRKAREWAGKSGLSSPVPALWNHPFAVDTLAEVIATLDPEGPLGANEQNVAAVMGSLRILLLMQAPPEDRPGLFEGPGPHLESVENPSPAEGE